MRDAAGINQAFAELLTRYHGTLDLLSGQGLQELDRHIAESVGYAELIEELVGESPTIVDVGSGAGLPGVVVAAALPEAEVLLVERRRRRGAFLELAASRLGLENVSVVKGDVRRLGDVCADVITAQAVAGMADVIKLTRHIQRDPCLLVSRRGPNWLEELSAVRGLMEREEARDSAAGEGERPLPPSPSSGRDGSEPAGDEKTSAFSVAAERRLEHRGSLIALRLTGGPACRSSGS